MAELKYFNALMATVLGNDQEAAEAKKYLAEVDPEIWEEQKRARNTAGFSTGLRVNCG